MNTLTDKEIKVHGVEMLIQNLGLVETERFISLMNRKGFDYTEWRRDLWKGETIEEVSSRAMAEYKPKH
jgi:hypothetical protein